MLLAASETGTPRERVRHEILSDVYYFNSRMVAFSWTQAGGTIRLPGGDNGAAYAVNGSGQIVGVATADNSAWYASLWPPAGGIINLGTLGGNSGANAANSSGQVVGYSNLVGDTAYHAFSWTQAGGMVDLGTLGGSNSVAYSVNTKGRVIGNSTTVGEAATHAVTWR